MRAIRYCRTTITRRDARDDIGFECAIAEIWRRFSRVRCSRGGYMIIRGHDLNAAFSAILDYALGEGMSFAFKILTISYGAGD